MAFIVSQRYRLGPAFTQYYADRYNLRPGDTVIVREASNDGRSASFTREDGTLIEGTWMNLPGPAVWFTLIEEEQPADRYTLVWENTNGRMTISGGPYDSPEDAYYRALGRQYTDGTLQWPLYGDCVAVHAVPLRAVATLSAAGLQVHGGPEVGNAA